MSHLFTFSAQSLEKSSSLGISYRRVSINQVSGLKTFITARRARRNLGLFCLLHFISFSSPTWCVENRLSSLSDNRTVFAHAESIRTSTQPMRVGVECTTKPSSFIFYIRLFIEHQIARYTFPSNASFICVLWRLKRLSRQWSEQFERVKIQRKVFPFSSRGTRWNVKRD